jgi:hypothetical protein
MSDLSHREVIGGNKTTIFNPRGNVVLTWRGIEKRPTCRLWLDDSRLTHFVLHLRCKSLSAVTKVLGLQLDDGGEVIQYSRSWELAEKSLIGVEGATDEDRVELTLEIIECISRYQARSQCRSVER